MLTLFDRDSRRNRRSFLKIGGSAAIAAGGLSLSDLAALRARAETIPGVLTGKSVIFLFLHGGPSQFETFDPKMSAPAEVRSATGEIKTRLPGVTFGSTYPKLAAMADRLCVVRSFVSPQVWRPSRRPSSRPSSSLSSQPSSPPSPALSSPSSRSPSARA